MKLENLKTPEMCLSWKWVLSQKVAPVFLCLWHPLAWKKYFLQHAENCVSTSVFAGHWPKNIVNIVIFVTRGKQTSYIPWFWASEAQKHLYLRCFFAPRASKKTWKHQPIWRFLATTRLRTKLHGQQQQQQQQRKQRNLWSEYCPPDLNHKKSPKIYQIECQKELQKIYEIKCECQIAQQKICQISITWWGSLEENI